METAPVVAKKELKVTTEGAPSRAGAPANESWAIEPGEEFWRGAVDADAGEFGFDLGSIMERTGNAFRMIDGGLETRSYTHRATLTDNGFRFEPFLPSKRGLRSRAPSALGIDVEEFNELQERAQLKAAPEPNVAIEWDLLAVEIDGTRITSFDEWTVRENVAQRRITGESVEIVEHVRAGDAGIERTWVLPSKTTDSVRFVTKTTGLARMQHEGATRHFRDFVGIARSRLSDPVLVDAAGTRTRLEARESNGRLIYEIPEALLASAVFPVALDPLLTSEFGIGLAVSTVAGDQSAADTAALPNGESVVVWEDWRSGSAEIYLARLNQTATNVYHPSVHVASGYAPRVDCNPGLSQCAIVYTREGGSSYSVYSRIVHPSTGGVDPEVHVYGQPSSWYGRNPDVASIPNGWIVAFEGIMGTGSHLLPDGSWAYHSGSPATDVLARRLEPHGVLPGVAVVAQSTSGNPMSGPRLGANGMAQEVFAAWQSTLHGLRVANLSATTGQRLLPDYPASIYGGDVYSTSYAVSQDSGGNGFVVWSDGSTIDCAHYFGFPYYVGSQCYPVISAPAANGLAVTWTDHHYRMVWSSNGTIYSAEPGGSTTTLHSGSSVLSSPGISCAGPNCQVLWSRESTGDEDLYSLTVSDNGSVLSPVAGVVSPERANQWRPKIARSSAEALVTWMDARTGSSSLYGVKLSLGETPAPIGSGFHIGPSGTWAGDYVNQWDVASAGGSFQLLVNSLSTTSGYQGRTRLVVLYNDHDGNVANFTRDLYQSGPYWAPVRLLSYPMGAGLAALYPVWWGLNFHEVTASGTVFGSTTLPVPIAVAPSHVDGVLHPSNGRLSTVTVGYNESLQANAIQQTVVSGSFGSHTVLGTQVYLPGSVSGVSAAASESEFFVGFSDASTIRLLRTPADGPFDGTFVEASTGTFSSPKLESLEGDGAGYLMSYSSAGSDALYGRYLTALDSVCGSDAEIVAATEDRLVLSSDAIALQEGRFLSVYERKVDGYSEVRGRVFATVPGQDDCDNGTSPGTLSVAEVGGQALVTWVDRWPGTGALYGSFYTTGASPTKIGSDFVIHPGPVTAHDLAPDGAHAVVAFSNAQGLQTRTVSNVGALGTVNMIDDGAPHVVPSLAPDDAGSLLWTDSAQRVMHVFLNPDASRVWSPAFITDGANAIDVVGGVAGHLLVQTNTSLDLLSFSYDGEFGLTITGRTAIESSSAGPIRLSELGSDFAVSWTAPSGEVINTIARWAPSLGRFVSVESTAINAGNPSALAFSANDGSATLVGLIDGDGAYTGVSAASVQSCSVPVSLGADIGHRVADAVSLGTDNYFVASIRYDSASHSHVKDVLTLSGLGQPSPTGYCDCYAVPEVVGDGIDQDCDGFENCYQDSDSDQWGVDTLQYGLDGTCDDPFLAYQSGDCDDADPTRNPGLDETVGSAVGNDVDENCDGFYTCYLDEDGDTYGSPHNTDVDVTLFSGCSDVSAVDTAGLPVSTNWLDCEGPGGNWNDPTVNPNATEICDQVDNNCDGYVNEGFEELYEPCPVAPGICPDAKMVCSADGLSLVCNEGGEPVNESQHDGRDNDCDGVIDEAPEACTVGLGACEARGTLNHYGHCSVHNQPTPSVEICNLIDDDCDGEVDEDCSETCVGAGLVSRDTSGTTLRGCVPAELDDDALFSAVNSTHFPPLSGRFHVTDTGAAQYHYEIPVLPGRGGMQPPLTLTVGGNAHTEFGTGVTMSGQSSIARCRRTMFVHGEARAVEYDAGDAYCLDGQPLLPWHANTCEIGHVELRPRSDSRVRVCMTAEDANGPESFAVFYQSGQVHHYGVSGNERLTRPNSSVRRVWYISAAIDRFGNGRTYRYIDTDGSSEDIFLGLDQITYTDRFQSRLEPVVVEPGQRRVRLVREIRPAISGFFEGEAYSLTTRVVAIELSGPGSDDLAKRTVYLAHDSANGTLGTIRLGAGGKSASPISFEYHPRTDFSNLTLDRTAYEAASRVDLNGDGYPEYVTSSGVLSDGTRIQFGGAHGTRTEDATVTVEARYETGDGPTGHLADPPAGPLTFDARSWRVIDLNGDSWADVASCSATGHHHRVSFGPGQGFGTSQVSSSCVQLLPGQADLNGDGYSDYVVVHSVAAYVANYSIVLTGDGNHQVISVSRGENDPDGAEVWRDTSFGDMNSDGASDLVFRDGQYFTCAGSVGAATCQSRVVSMPNIEPTLRDSLADEVGGDDFTLLDVNNDGNQDLLISSHIESTPTEPFLCPLERRLAVYLGTGSQPDPWQVLFDERGCTLGRFAGHVELDGDPSVELAVHRHGALRLFNLRTRSCSTANGCLTEIAEIDGDGSPQGSVSVANVVGGDQTPDILIGETIYRGASGYGPSFLLSEVRDGWNSFYGEDGPSTRISYQMGYSVRESSRCANEAGLLCYQPQAPLVREVRRPTSVGSSLDQVSLYRFVDGSVVRGGGGFAGYETVERVVVESDALAFDGSLLPGRLGVEYTRAFEHRNLSGFLVPGLLISDSRVDWRADGTRLLSKVVYTPAAYQSVAGQHYFLYDAQIQRVEAGDSVWRVHERIVDSIDADGHERVVREQRRVTAEGVNTVPNAAARARLTEATTSATTVTTTEYLSGHREGFEGWPRESSVERRTSDCAAGVSRCAEGGFHRSELAFQSNVLTGAVEQIVLNPNASTLSEKLQLDFQYDDDGNVTQVEQEGVEDDTGGLPVSRVWRIGYDAHENMYPIWSLNPEGHVVQRGYWQSTGTPIFEMDPNQLVTTYLRDELGGVLSVNEPDGRSVTVSVYARGDSGIEDLESLGAGLARRVESNTGEQYTSYFDHFGRTILEKELAPSGFIVREVDFDHLGRAYRYTRPRFEGSAPTWLASQYDGTLARPLTEQTRAGVRQYEYFGTLGVKVTDEGGRHAELYFDAEERVVMSTDALNTANLMRYTPSGRLLDVKVAGMSTLRNAYDSVGRLRSTFSPDRNTRTYAHNSFGEIISSVDALGEAERVTRDRLGRETRRDYSLPDGSSLRSLVFWDSAIGAGVGKPGRVRSFDGHERIYEYTDRGQLASETQFLNGFRWSPWALTTKTYSYDAQGQLYSQTYPSLDQSQPATTLEYLHTAGWTTSIEHDGLQVWSLHEHNADGRPLLETQGNGTQLSSAYDPVAGWLKSKDVRKSDGTPLYWQDVKQFDAVGNIEQIEQSRWTGSGPLELRTLVMSYDALDRLTSVTDPVGTGRSLIYDHLGNIQSQTGVGTYDYSGRVFSPSAVNGIIQTYDANGNLTGSGDASGRRIDYAPNDRPRSISQGGNEISFEYGPGNEAIVERRGNSVKVRFGSWEVDAPVSAGTSIDGVIQTISVEANGVVAQRVLVSTGSSPTVSWDVQWHYQVRDITGSLVGSTDQSGELEYQQEYDAFGELVWSSDGAGRTSLGSGYTGHLDLHGFGLVSMKARLYDPRLARFINADPVMQAPLYSQSSNRYAYVFNNPLRYTDPTGMVATDEPPTHRDDSGNGSSSGGGTYPNDPCGQDPGACGARRDSSGVGLGGGGASPSVGGGRIRNEAEQPRIADADDDENYLLASVTDEGVGLDENGDEVRNVSVRLLAGQLNSSKSSLYLAAGVVGVGVLGLSTEFYLLAAIPAVKVALVVGAIGLSIYTVETLLNENTKDEVDAPKEEAKPDAKKGKLVPNKSLDAGEGLSLDDAVAEVAAGG
ncbi:MAG: MopE-related protein, partial [Myxococcota bacterium]